MIPNPADIPPPPPRPRDAREAPRPRDQARDDRAGDDDDVQRATKELLRQSLEAKDNAMALISSVQNVVGTVESAVREQMQARPYMTMGAAAGVGYVLAGGLASSVTRRLMSAGTKAATAFVVGLVLKKVQDAAAPDEGAAAPDDDE